jgi:hypothetical protein
MYVSRPAPVSKSRKGGFRPMRYVFVPKVMIRRKQTLSKNPVRTLQRELAGVLIE